MSKDFVNQYAKALFEVAGDLKTKSAYLDELRAVDKIISQNESVLNFFKSVEVPAEVKQKIVTKALENHGISKNVLSMIKLVIDRNKIAYLDKMLLAYQALNDEANGVVRGVVKSSHELSGKERTLMAEKIESVLNKKVILDYVQDTKVIGGLKAQVGSYTFDDTFETHLMKMKELINRRTH